MGKDINYYIKMLLEKDRQVNEYCAKIRRNEFKLVVNNGRSLIDWAEYN
jgi:hypothetical protein